MRLTRNLFNNILIFIQASFAYDVFMNAEEINPVKIENSVACSLGLTRRRRLNIFINDN